MPGFCAIIPDTPPPTWPSLPSREGSPLRVTRHTCDGKLIEQYVIDQFRDDKVFAWDSDILICLSGVILNVEMLQAQVGADSVFNTIKQLYQTKGMDFLNALRGEFAGFILDRNRNEWMAFTSPTGQKALFYYQHEEICIVATEATTIAAILREMGRPYSLDEVAAFCLLTYGCMLDDLTLVTEIRKVPCGSAVTAGPASPFRVQSYHRFAKSDYLSASPRDLVEEIDVRFQHAVELEYGKDRQAGYNRHIVTLSGGLDSRMSLFAARRYGVTDFSCFTCSPTGYYDHVISKEIAGDLGADYRFVPLDAPDYLYDVEAPLGMNDGLVVSYGSAHLLSAYKQCNFASHGLLHTGMIGDGVLGSLLSRPYDKKPSLESGAISTMLLDVAAPDLRKILDRYSTEEEFKLYNRCFNSALNGHWSLAGYSASASPFLDPDLISYCLNIAPSRKYKERLYMDWIKTKYPVAAQYRWERTRLKPTVWWSVAFMAKILRYAYYRVVQKPRINTMVPVPYWYSQHDEFRTCVDCYYRENLERLRPYALLFEGVQRLYTEGSCFEKLQAISLMASMKIYFNVS